MPPIRMILATLGTALAAGCTALRFESGNPPRKTTEERYREPKFYPLEEGRSLTVMNSDPNNVLAEVTGPCRTDQEATDAARVKEEIEKRVCGDPDRYEFRITSPVRSFFELETRCDMALFRQMIGGVCQAAPEVTE